ncbi:MAG: hypothetical protein WC140_00380 [Bacteroidales bacterium]
MRKLKKCALPLLLILIITSIVSVQKDTIVLNFKKNQYKQNLTSIYTD